MTHLPWGWIKQRPQFIAEELSKDYILDVYYRKSNHNQKGVNSRIIQKNLNIRGFRNFPFERLKFMPKKIGDAINRLLWRVKHINLDNYDYIWVTNPAIWKHFIDGCNTKGKIIYDCMDDYSAFPYMDMYPELRNHMEKCERELIEFTDYFLCSAESLKNKLLTKYNLSRKCNIINNAITSDIMHYEDYSSDIYIPPISLTYIGTISEWIDFDNLLKLLDNNQKLHVILYGPMRMTNFPSHDRLEWRGVIPHNKILSVMNASSALIMPFIVNELIESVNPVKLYEYIYSGKPIVASKYSETIKFDKYVSLYSNYDELQSFVNNYLYNNASLDKKSMREFAIGNTWQARKDQINRIINEA